MATQQGVIKTLMTALDTTTLKGTAAVDAAIKASSNFGSTQAIIDKMVAELKNYVAADSKNGWKNFLKLRCGIDLDNDDTGAITGSDAGGTTTKTAESIIPEIGSLKNYKKNSFTKNGLTFTLEKDFKKLSPEQQFIWKALYTWWAKGALDLIKTSYGYSFNDSDVNFTEVNVKFVDDSTTTWLAWSSWNDFDSDGKIDKAALNINMNKYKNIDITNPNGRSSATKFYLDKTLAHEFTHLVSYAKIDYETELPEFISEGLAELTIGIDDERKSDITYLAKNPSVLEKNLSGTSTVYSYEAGYMFLRYFAKQAVSKSVYGTTGNDFLNNTTSGATISALAGNDTVRNAASKVFISGDNGNDSVNNSGNTVSIFGGAGNDTIKNYGTKVTIDGGNNDDKLYNYASSKVTLSGGAGADTITNWGGAASMVGGNGNDVIWGDAGNDTILGDADNDKLHGEGGNDKIYGGNGNDSLWGGKGNDSLWGNAGADTFIYANGDGKDIIFGFENSDMLKITGTFSTTYNKSKKEIYFKVDSTANAITLKDFGSTSTFNVNGTNYKIGSSGLVKK